MNRRGECKEVWELSWAFSGREKWLSSTQALSTVSQKHVTRSGNKYHPLFALESSVTKKPWTVSVSCLPIPTGYDVYRFIVQEYAKPEGIQSIRVPQRNFYSSKNERNRDFLNSEIQRKPKSFQKWVPLRIERNIVSLIKRCGNQVNENCFSRDMVRSQ